jgi:hypothetical protein
MNKLGEELGIEQPIADSVGRETMMKRVCSQEMNKTV